MSAKVEVVNFTNGDRNTFINLSEAIQFAWGVESVLPVFGGPQSCEKMEGSTYTFSQLVALRAQPALQKLSSAFQGKAGHSIILVPTESVETLVLRPETSDSDVIVVPSTFDNEQVQDQDIEEQFSLLENNFTKECDDQRNLMQSIGKINEHAYTFLIPTLSSLEALCLAQQQTLLALQGSSPPNVDADEVNSLLSAFEDNKIQANLASAKAIAEEKQTQLTELFSSVRVAVELDEEHRQAIATAAASETRDKAKFHDLNRPTNLGASQLSLEEAQQIEKTLLREVANYVTVASAWASKASALIPFSKNEEEKEQEETEQEEKEHMEKEQRDMEECTAELKTSPKQAHDGAAGKNEAVGTTASISAQKLSVVDMSVSTIQQSGVVGVAQLQREARDLRKQLEDSRRQFSALQHEHLLAMDESSHLKQKLQRFQAQQTTAPTVGDSTAASASSDDGEAKRNEEMKAQISLANQAAENLRAKIESLESAYKEKETDLADARRQLEEEQAASGKLQAALEGVRQQLQKKEEETEKAEEEQVTEQHSTGADANAEHEAVVAQLRSEISALQQQLEAQARDDKAALSARAEAMAVVKEKEELQRQANDLVERVVQVQQERDEACESLLESKRSVSVLEARVSELETELSKKVSDSTEAGQRLQQLISDLEIECNQLRGRDAERTGQIQALENDNAKLARDLKTLQENSVVKDPESIVLPRSEYDRLVAAADECESLRPELVFIKEQHMPALEQREKELEQQISALSVRLSQKETEVMQFQADTVRLKEEINIMRSYSAEMGSDSGQGDGGSVRVNLRDPVEADHTIIVSKSANGNWTRLGDDSVALMDECVQELGLIGNNVPAAVVLRVIMVHNFGGSLGVFATRL